MCSAHATSIAEYCVLLDKVIAYVSYLQGEDRGGYGQLAASAAPFEAPRSVIN